MKSLFTYLTMILLVIGCSSNDENPTQDTSEDLIISSYSPTSAMVGNEITFIGENIDTSKEYSVLFNGIASENVQNFPSEIKAIVPQNATTGEIIIKYDNKSLTVGELEITEELPLIITSFSPTTASPGDDVIFIGENIDPTVTYTVLFNGVEGETTNVTENEIVARIPEGATTGEIKISYQDSTLSVGSIEIIDEIDKLYGSFSVDGAGCEAFYIYSLDINNGALLEEQTLLNANNCYSYLSFNFYRNANIFVHTFFERWSQGEPYYKKALIKNFNTGYQATWILRDEGDRDGSILAAYDNKIYYSYRYFLDVDETYEVRVRNLDTGITTTAYNFPLDYMYDFKNSGFLPSTNELIFFTTDQTDQPVFMKINVETSVLTSQPISDTYTHIFITATANERVFGVKSLGGDEHEIVEIDKGSGNILASLTTISTREVLNIDYSISSNRVFALLRDTNNDQYLYKLNLNDGTSTTTLLDEQNDRDDFYGIYLNN